MTSIPVDLDGDGHQEYLVGNKDVTQVIKNGNIIWSHKGAIDGWNRSDDDLFFPADLDGDGRQEIVVADDKDRWTGVWKWDGQNLHTIWGSPSPLHGPAGGWNRGWDIIMPCDVDDDGCMEIVIANNTDRWTGVLKWQGALGPVWMSPSPLHGPAGSWARSGSDMFSTGGDHLVHICNGQVSGVLEWQNGSLALIEIAQHPPQFSLVTILLERDQTTGTTWRSVSEAGGDQAKPIVHVTLSVPTVWNVKQATVTHVGAGSTVMSAPGITTAFNGQEPAGSWTVSFAPDPNLTDDTCSLLAMTSG